MPEKRTRDQIYASAYRNLDAAKAEGQKDGTTAHNKDAEIEDLNKAMTDIEERRADLLGPHAEDFPGKDVR